ncbi:hypothetical protein [Acidithiobacillus albertensis]|uniref:hypothetical protein n=1 Tax=Acidithiobacillus albertensis TaxID=119978 RepID=UPI001C06D701|nr:hypothetical protein [Acidithiobacillus albertensis]MBU2741627.1 hypothetical protein [Acidithiobacillus albertensis]
MKSLSDEQLLKMKEDRETIKCILDQFGGPSRYYEDDFWDERRNNYSRAWWETHAPHAITQNPKTGLYHVINWHGETYREYHVTGDYEERLVICGLDIFGLNTLPDLELLIFYEKFFGRYDACVPWVFYEANDAPWLGGEYAVSYVKRWLLMKCVWENHFKILGPEPEPEPKTTHPEGLFFNLDD